MLLALGVRGIDRRTREHPALDPGHRTGIGTTVALVAIAAGLWLAVLRPPADVASVTVLDVGQGLAVLVSDGRRTLLIDAGPPDGAVLRALPEAGVRHGLDAVILSPPDLDPTGGVEPLARRIAVGGLLGAQESLEVITLPGESIQIGDRVRLTSRTSIEVIAPPVATRGLTHASRNDASLVLLVTVGDRRVLLTGDIEAPAEAWLIASGQRLHADVLLVPHHGSDSSSTAPFIEAVSPAIAIVSAGEGNRYGHPAEGVLERYEASGVAVLRTDLGGNVTISSDGDRMWWRTER
ncbi:MAG: ComEC/Rec2 family competence protein [Chloroflexi bacterium]|nr:ComEC/Rec2 family competence protein [Chloroflexota bacterium]